MHRRGFLGMARSGVFPFLAGCLNDPGRDGGLSEGFEADHLPETTITARVLPPRGMGILMVPRSTRVRTRHPCNRNRRLLYARASG